MSEMEPPGVRKEDIPEHAPTPRGAAKLAFTKGELQAILETAARMPWTLRSGPDYRTHGEYVPDFEGRTDGSFVDRTVRVLLFTGVHISLLPHLRSTNLHRAPEGWLEVEWHRTKRTVGGRQRLMTAVVPTWAEDWIAEYLDLPKPTASRSYHYMLARLSDQILKERGIRIQINPLRFRHTAGVLYVEQMGFNQAEIAEVLGTSKQTSMYYTTRQSAHQRAVIAGKGGLRVDG